MRNEPIETKDLAYKGHKIRIAIYRDDDMEAPWKEHDGHGVVRETRNTEDKHAGERVLARGQCLYDFKATTELAKKDGWGIGDEKVLAELARKLGHEPSKNEIVAEAVQMDFDHCKGWLDDEWRWVGYTATIVDPEGHEHDGDSCWGYEWGMSKHWDDCVWSEAEGAAELAVEDLIEQENITQAARNWP